MAGFAQLGCFATFAELGLLVRRIVAGQLVGAGGGEGSSCCLLIELNKFVNATTMSQTNYIVEYYSEQVQ